MEASHTIDARGMKCPLPVLRARKALLGMAPGEVLQVIADDPMAAIDMPHFCREAGHELIDSTPYRAATAYLICRGPTP